MHESLQEIFRQLEEEGFFSDELYHATLNLDSKKR